MIGKASIIPIIISLGGASTSGSVVCTDVSAAKALSAALDVDLVKDWPGMRAKVQREDNGEFFVSLHYEPSTPGRVIFLTVDRCGIVRDVRPGL